MKNPCFAIVAFMIAACGCVHEKMSEQIVPRDPPTLDQYKKQIRDAGGTGVDTAEGVDIMLQDAVPVKIAAAIVGDAPLPLPGRPEGVCIAAWNLRWFPAGYPLKPDAEPDADHESRRTSSVARFIRWRNPDVVMLEEVRNRKVLEALVAHEALTNWTINAISDFPASYGAAIPTHQNAIISHLRTVDSGFQAWRRRRGIAPPRGFVWAVLDTGDNLVGVICVHLKSNYIGSDVEDKQLEASKNTLKREESSRQVVRFAESLLGKEYGGRKVTDVFVGGDYNMSIFDPAFAKELTMDILKDAGYRDVHAELPQGKRFTMPQSRWYPPTTFDYLLHKGSHETVDPEVAPPQYTSDHQLISVVLTGNVSTNKVTAAKLEPLEFDVEGGEEIIKLE